MKLLGLLTMLLLLLVLLAICSPKEEHIDVVVSYKGESGASGLQVFLLAGTDTDRRDVLQAGDRQRWRLYPGKAVVLAHERSLYVRYYPVGRPEIDWGWLGPELPMNVSYRIALDIHSDGQVTHRYCIKPCKLSNQAKDLSP